LRQEARSRHRDIHLDNIGELKNQIKAMCASACSDNREGEVITLRGPVSGGEIIRIAGNADDGVLSTSQLLPKAMSDER
jgi:transcriptional regulator with AAA-type ATPase domain